MVYDGNISLCNETPNKGGLNLSKVKQIAENNFNIDTKHKKKEEICKLIEDKLNDIVNKDKKRKQKEERLDKVKSDKDEDEDEDKEDNDDDEEDDLEEEAEDN